MRWGHDFLLAVSVVGLSAGQGFSQPPTASNPTSEQARAFIENMIEQHSTISCSLPGPDKISDFYSVKSLLKIDRNRIILQSTDTERVVPKGSEEFEIGDIDIMSFLVTEVDATLVNMHGICSNPVNLYFDCKSGAECVKVTRRTQDINNKPRELSLSAARAVVELNDQSVGERILRAFAFYQQHAPAAAPSPF